MPADVIEFRTSQQRFAVAFARYDLVTLVKAALEELGEELDATFGDDRRAILHRNFHAGWIAYCGSDVSETEIAETRARISGLRDEIRPLILAVVAAHDTTIGARGLD